MTHTNLITSFGWRLVKPLVAPAVVEARPAGDDDSREATFVENLEPEWIQALEAADYSHLESKLKKQPA
jgi:hypothetical protein